MKKISAALAASLLLVLPGITAAASYYNPYGGYGYRNSGYNSYPMTYQQMNYPPMQQNVYYSWGNPSLSMPEYGCYGVYQYTPCQVTYQQPQMQYPMYNYYQQPQRQYYQPQQYNNPYMNMNPYLFNTNTNTNTNTNNNNINIVNTSNAYAYAQMPFYGYSW